MRATQQYRYRQTMRRHRGHHTRFDVMRTRVFDDGGSRLLGAGRGRIEIKKNAARTDAARCFLRDGQRTGRRDRRDHEVRLLAQLLRRITGCDLVRVCVQTLRAAENSITKNHVPGPDPGNTFRLESVRENLADFAVADESNMQIGHCCPSPVFESLYASLFVSEFSRARSRLPAS